MRVYFCHAKGQNNPDNDLKVLFLNVHLKENDVFCVDRDMCVSILHSPYFVMKNIYTRLRMFIFVV